MLKSLCIAFSTYSRIPMPKVEWNEKNMRWSMCFFPVIGLVIGGLELLWAWLGSLLDAPALLRGAVAAALPILLTGGIHLDGFCDTVDALSSHQSRERKLEILKDSHTGAFAVIFCGVWLILSLAGWSALSDLPGLYAAGLGYVLSRALSALALANWKCARENGMLRAFADAARRRGVTIVMLVYITLCAAGMILLAGWRGCLGLAVNALVFLYYRLMSYRQFGGVTGDLAGWFTQMAELGTILVLALTEGIA